VAGLIGRNKTGSATEVAFGVVRALDYLTIALMVGGLIFVILAWLPGLRDVAGAEPEWSSAARVFARRMRSLFAFAVVLGLLVSVLGILLQGATAAGVSLWGSLKRSVIQNTLESRFGKVWGLRAIDWLVLGGLLVLAGALRNRPAARGGAARGAEVPDGQDRSADPAGSAPDPGGVPAPHWLAALIAVAAAYLVATPALSGHASVQSPTAVFFPSDFLHVLGASVWVGGIACLLLALPGATAELQAPQRSRLLLGTLTRFSPVALASVIAIAASGIVQAYIDVRTLEALFHTTYGTLIIVKVVLLALLICLGWVNRERVIPALGRIVAAGRTPGEAGILARRTMRGELVLMLCVFGVTAALVSYAPPIDAASGPFSTSTTLGPAELEMTVEPAKVGLNTVHLYLIDATSGVQYTASKELTAKASLPSKGIGPLPLQASAAGPGHYILSSADLSPGGTWEIAITDRISEFESFNRTVKVPIR
ncbi:MAG TPA: CopD family protein, partial [Solirubrobacteraceae bacterium]|nr:CopD family protein [Solirubrobacteraceae bacterium]